ncbi:MAG: hypothetical protein A3A72_05355 [Deltaproteobacteria bacterium RIFCSPLOWO2_01_FULL_38_9]|nr:MAG: hypothetical protein A3A72_05355 [Deltaproteobacteria bacterium RIFCSPLOWO2_01_FULL_38_9]
MGSRFSGIEIKKWIICGGSGFEKRTACRCEAKDNNKAIYRYRRPSYRINKCVIGLGGAEREAPPAAPGTK